MKTERTPLLRELRTAGLVFAVFTALTGLAYPLAITGLAQIAWPHQANGSRIVRGGQLVGSELIGQAFSDARHFWGRPSATAPYPYNAGASGGSNLAASNPAQAEARRARAARLRAADPDNSAPIPVDLLTASGSGLDPHISVAAAEYQVRRVARIRGMSEAAVRELVRACTENPQCGVLGEPRVNVLALNLALR